MGRWKPRRKKIPAWAASAPKQLVDEIVRKFPKIFPSDSTRPLIFDALDAHLRERLGVGEGEPQACTLDDFESGFAHAALLCGMDPAYIHAFRVTGAWVTLEQISFYLDQETVVRDWIEAVHAHRKEFPPPDP